MAEPEEIDEDLFADLYDNEEPVPQVDESANQPTPAEPTPPAHPANAPDTEMTAGEDGADDTGPRLNHQQTSENGATFDQNDGGWHGNDAATDNDRGSAAAPEHIGIAIKEDGKMFIGGLNWETTDESLRRHFEEFGEVVECTVMRDAATGRSRGFGFLTFKDPKTVNTVMVKEHFLDGKIIDPKRAIPRDEQERTSKIFVGGVSQEATEEDFKNYFTQYGRVIDATLMIDKDTKRPRGFGFVTFDSEAAVEATLKGDLIILGKPIEVKRAQPRGSVKEEEDSLRRGRGRGRGNDMQNDGGGGGMGQGGGMGYANGMTPQMMAQYFQRMQQYFANMMAGMGGGMMGGMNPAMMQQMQQMQRMQQQGGMTPQMMQQMQQQMQQQQQQQQQQQPQQQQQQAQQQQQQQAQQPPQGQGGANGPINAPSGPASMNNPGGGRRNQQGNIGYQSGPTSWEGMYDDVPQPDMGPGNGGNGGGGMGGGRRGHDHGYGRGGRHPPKQPSAAPANAPTGPRNAGVPGANYRGGGRGNHHRGGYHPYGRR